MDIYPGCKLHQISPYIGKVRPSLARQLVLEYTRNNDWVWDPFCGSGTIPLECKLLSRNAVAGDINPYACAITRAKLHAPASESRCFKILSDISDFLSNSSTNDLKDIPKWVSNFFHERTLSETILLMKRLINTKQYFLIGCLLGILHHQRPGFLSYPASHLVPYLRNKLYPSDIYPEAYKYRDPIPRLRAKVTRVLAYPPPNKTSEFRIFKHSALSQYLPNESVDAVITSPPYMNNLDYARDNRLRLWFLNIDEYKAIKDDEIGAIGTFDNDMYNCLKVMLRCVRDGAVFIFIFGDLCRGNHRYDIPTRIKNLIENYMPELNLEKTFVEQIPFENRSRKNGRATKEETIMVFRCDRRRY